MFLNRQPVEGWRRSAICFLVFIWALALGLLALLGLSIRASGSLDSSSALFRGNCGTAKQRTLTAHVVINIVSTAVLLSSSFFLMLVVSPTRHDVDKAHRRSRYLDIGVVSVRNLRWLPGSRTILWLLLASASLPLHMLFNSCVYDVGSTTDFLEVFASEAWLHRAPYALPGVGLNPYPESDSYGNNTIKRRELTYISQNAAGWVVLDGNACFAAYSGGGGVRQRRHLVVLITNVSADGMWDTRKVWGPSYPAATLSSLWAQRVCGSFVPQSGEETSPYNCGYVPSYVPGRSKSLLFFDPPTKPPPPGANWTIHWSGFDGYFRYIQPESQRLQGGYCLSEPWVATCRSEVSNVLLLVVCCFVLAHAVLCTVALGLLWHKPLLTTSGDAVESFLTRPDPATVGMCTFGVRDFSKLPPGTGGDEAPLSSWTPAPRQWVARKARCGQAVTTVVWVFMYTVGGILWMIGLIVWASKLGSFRWDESEFGFSPTNPQTQRFLQTFNLTSTPNLNTHLTEYALLANLLQLLVSPFYFVLLAFLTRMATAQEWGRLAAGYQPLRVNAPRGEQLGSYLLQMPWLWALATQVWSALLHFLVSQSMYLFADDGQDYRGNPSSHSVGIGLSMNAMFTALMVALGTMALPLIVARLRLAAQTVVPGNSSAAISAACHPPPSGSDLALPVEEGSGGSSTPTCDMQEMQTRQVRPGDGETVPKAQQKLRWGVIPGERSIQLDDGNWVTAGHLSFGTEADSVEEVVDEAWYAG